MADIAALAAVILSGNRNITPATAVAIAREVVAEAEKPESDVVALKEPGRRVDPETVAPKDVAQVHPTKENK